MSEKNFVVTGSIQIDDKTLDLTNTQVGSSLHRIGNTITAKRETPIGTVIMYTGLINGGKTNVPNGWLLCDGSEIAISSYPDLDSIVGTRYGARTNGSGGDVPLTHFRVPNLVDRVPIGHIQTNSDAPNTVSTPSSTEGYNHSHTRAHSSSSWGDGAGEFSGHGHGVNPHGHNHGNSGDAGSADVHNLGGAGAHTHNYKPGDANAQSSFSDSNHTHGLNSDNANHSHNAIGNAENHGHQGVATSLQHTHQVTMSTSDANQTMNQSSHQHSGGFSSVKVFFIIKAEHGV
jgi:microcystin-dependent protein